MLRRGIATVLWLMAFGAAATAGGWAQNIFVTPIPNSPFSAMIQEQRSFLKPDGTVTSVSSTNMIARDSQGRIRYEVWPPDSREVPKIVRVHLYDPQTRISTMLFPDEKRYWSMTLNRPPATEPPGAQYASPAGSTLPLNQFTQEEDLGTREMEGMMVHGVRETQTIPAEKSGTGRDVKVTDEYWYSEDLHINMVIKHKDPRRGSRTQIVTAVQLSEPDASLFEIPEGYKDGRPSAKPATTAQRGTK